MERLKPNSMFSRLMVLFTVMILIIMAFLTSVFYVSVRNSRIENHLKELEVQANEMAYLLGQRYEYSVKSTIPSFFSFSREAQLGYHNTDQYMTWKAKEIIQNFSADIIAFDTLNNAQYFTPTKKDDRREEKIKAFARVLPRVLEGETVVTKVNLENRRDGTMFVVAVPYLGTGQEVKGAVLIHTSVQEVRATYLPLLYQVVAVTVVAFALAIIFAYIFTKQMTKPLASMVKATEEMAKGNFEQKAEVEGSEEIQKLATSFNMMAKQLDQLEKSRREFVANVSHELRSPMTSIHGFIQGMLDGTIPQEEQPKYLKIVSDETTRLTKLINELLQLSRVEQEKTAHHIGTFDINELMRRVLVRRYQDIDQKQIEMEIQFEEESCICQGDMDSLEQVVVNLLDNAIKFTPDNGTIWMGSKEEKEKVLVWIEDDGQEISKEDLPFIFDRFYKVDKAHSPGKGTGLGLSISKTIINQLGEEIWCESGGGKTSFSFTLKKAIKEESGKEGKKSDDKK